MAESNSNNKSKTPKSRSDIAVQCTNDSSIVSKASMVDVGYFADPYVSYFVSKRRRRSPIINRGYYVRAKAVDTIVDQFLEIYGKQSNQILSLGAGFDSLYFRLKQEGHLENTLYVEVDFPDLVARKTRIIEHYDCLSELVNNEGCKPDGNIVVNGHGYKLLGVDLTNLPLLQSTLTRCGVQFEAPTLLLSEVVFTYIPRDKCSSVIEWAAKSFSSAVFVIYEQVHPDDAFGIVMMKHFEKIGSPLKCIRNYPDPESQKSRFLSLGWDCCCVTDMNQFYQSLCHEERRRIAALETFDEYEEWHLKCAHYVLVCAFKGPMAQLHTSWLSHCHGNPVDSSAIDNVKHPNTLYPRPCSDLFSAGVKTDSYAAYKTVDTLTDSANEDVEKHFKNGTDNMNEERAWQHTPWERPLSEDGVYKRLPGTYEMCQRFGHTLTALDDSFVMIGGFGDVSGKHSRMNDVISYNFRDNEYEVIEQDLEGVGSRIYHSTCVIENSDLLIFGGRTSPAKPGKPMVVLSKAAGRQSPGNALGNGWSRRSVATSGQSPCARWRHAAVVHRKDGDEELFIFGGRTENELALADCYRLQISSWTWEKIDGCGTVPCARHSMTADVWHDRLVIAGGLDAEEMPHASIHMMDTTTHTWSVLSTTPALCARYGHTSELVSDNLILVGGVNLQAPPPCIELVNLVTKTAFRIENHIQTPASPVMLHGHASATWRQNEELIIVGGGGNCFSFGSHLNRSPLAIDLSKI